jgi:hypothetical protein
MPTMSKKKSKELRGHKLIELLHFVYLHNRFSKEKIAISSLKRTVGYSTGGIYNAFESGYLEKKNDEVYLTEKGRKYVEEHILERYTVFNPIGYFFIFLGFMLIFQWFQWTYTGEIMIFEWYVGVLIIGFGFFLRFFLMRLTYWFMKLKMKNR